jgi:hypothetical protein|tara:strand:- start:6461 stop:6841 length:381 start_codon:yes stop_codon:yes gene_type:complete
MMRKIKSCPANLSTLVNRKKPELADNEKSKKKVPVIFLPSKASRIFKKGDAVDEIVTSGLNDAHVNDPGEQLLFLLILRRIFSKTKTNIITTCYEICVRSAISFTAHKAMEACIKEMHQHAHLISI